MNDSTYPWIILVPQRNHVREIFDLIPSEQAQLAEESSFVSLKMHYQFEADKMNIATLGNIVEQLHMHHIVRYKIDPAWPDPVWGKFPRKPYSFEKAEELKETLGNLLIEYMSIMGTS
jgi:diadenosine tetraphosphate (Ap4A) HIT family hydrolase